MARKRANGEGTVYWDAGRRRWMGAVTVPGTGRRARFSGRTQEEALDKKQALLAEVGKGLPVGGARIQIGPAFTEWVEKEMPRREVTAKTMENYRWSAAHIVAGLGRKPLRGLTADEVDGFLTAKAEAGMARNSLLRLHSHIKAFLRHAQRRGWVGQNVAELVTTPLGRPARRGRALTELEAKAFLAAIRGHRHEALWTMALMLGLRPGELLGLAWADVDFREATVQVRRALHDDGTIGKLKGGNASRSRRALKLPSPVVEALRSHKSRQAADRLAAGQWATVVDEEAERVELVFTTSSGTPLGRRNVARDLNLVTGRLGIGAMRNYDMRHTACSLLSAAGVPLEEVADILGHDPRMTAFIYRHRIKPAVTAGVAPMEAMFS